ncbi:hypothetical protein TELCIR_01725 [Teladorsagia circumcincta]|uniref:Leucine Rich repeat-containing domain protein n=1 Tax=Teladorsagia circumcincta TaxID=45464 RepID=A0A2G9V141_TELCI|nr:hypothetical protein TELCIR_01725 [Teladorsagia circumcincta]
MAEGTPIDLGESDDDEGTLSECSDEFVESENDSEDEEEDYDDEEEDLEAGGDRIDGDDGGDLSDLLNSMGDMKFTEPEASKVDDVVSFLNQQLKLDTAQDGIQEFLVSPAAFSLEVLKLNNNGLGAGGKVIATCLSECFVRSNLAKRRLKLKTFIAGRNRLEVPGAVALAEAFTKIGSLEEFAVPQNGITAKGVEALATCFKSNPNLRVINLNDNTATQLGSAAIAEALPSLPKLEVLNLGDCLCRDQGCHAIVDALSPMVHQALKEVDLSGAELSGAAAMQIVEKWKKFPSTTRLIISSNNFGGVFEDLRGMVAQNIVVGDSDDDQGSLSSDEEEKMSAEETDDEDDVNEEVTATPYNPPHFFTVTVLKTAFTAETILLWHDLNNADLWI